MSPASWVVIFLLVAAAGLTWRAARLPVERIAGTRLTVYAQTLLFLLVLATCSVVVIYKDGQSLSGFGVHAGNLSRAVGPGVAAAAVLALAVCGLERIAGFREKDLLVYLMPVTGVEKTVYILLAIVAGFSEEIIYRGFLIDRFSTLFGSVWLAALASSALFGFSHGYQGRVGIVRSGLIGLALASLYLRTGNLVTVMVTHAAYDLIVALVFARLLRPGR